MSLFAVAWHSPHVLSWLHAFPSRRRAFVVGGFASRREGRSFVKSLSPFAVLPMQEER